MKGNGSKKADGSKRNIPYIIAAIVVSLGIVVCAVVGVKSYLEYYQWEVSRGQYDPNRVKLTDDTSYMSPILTSELDPDLLPDNYDPNGLTRPNNKVYEADELTKVHSNSGKDMANVDRLQEALKPYSDDITYEVTNFVDGQSYIVLDGFNLMEMNDYEDLGHGTAVWQKGDYVVIAYPGKYSVMSEVSTNNIVGIIYNEEHGYFSNNDMNDLADHGLLREYCVPFCDTWGVLALGQELKVSIYQNSYPHE